MARRYKLKSKPGAYVERRKDGTFKKWTGIGKSLSADRRTKAKTKVKSGYGHKGDQAKNFKIGGRNYKY